MKCLNKKQWLLSWIGGVSIILFLAGVTYAQNQSTADQPLSGPLSPSDPAAKLDPSLLNVPPMPEPNPDQPLSGPLSPSDPAAKLDPSLLNVPPMPEQEESRSPTTPSTESPAREASYDIRTGSTQVGAITPVQDSSSTSFSPPNLGADSNVEPEFPGL